MVWSVGIWQDKLGSGADRYGKARYGKDRCGLVCMR